MDGTQPSGQSSHPKLRRPYPTVLTVCEPRQGTAAVERTFPEPEVRGGTVLSQAGKAREGLDYILKLRVLFCRALYSGAEGHVGEIVSVLASQTITNKSLLNNIKY